MGLRKYRIKIFTFIFVAGFAGVFFSGGSLNLPLRLAKPTDIDSSGGMGSRGKWSLVPFVRIVAGSGFSIDSETSTSIGTGPNSSSPGISTGKGSGSIGISTLCG
jgi:hypothetical protein